ncbi:Nif3-like dinuclear metal center hexameric protein [Sulfurimonas sp. MAG313]|nr:Nif3-like dinuclear metal center hexameric protein [Sulfurimonas sp. MAG313]MDF1881874.1 Nif3-like dinuclear metal center hexameric protein [Sulfurimonas sp. MAG313]
MSVEDIYKILNEISPFELQEPWDNSGLLVGDWKHEVNEVVLSIDIDEELLEELHEDTLIITHHPIIFGGLKQLQFNQYPAKLLQKMLQKNISNIAMHTNFDQTHLNAYVATQILGYKIVQKEGFVAYMEVNENYDTFANSISEKLGIEHIKCVKCHEFIKTIALTTGSGASLMKSIKADCFLTGDIKYHDAMEAKTMGLSMIDIGHFESEKYFGEVLAKDLINLGISVIISSSKNPFTYI